MKKFFIAIIMFMVTATSVAAIKGTPYIKEIDDRFNAIEQTQAGGTLADSKVLVGNGSNVATAVTLSGAISNDNAGVVSATDTIGDGNFALKVAKASYAFADGDLAIGAHSLGVNLPAKAVIIRSWIHVTLQQVDSGTCTMAFSCEDANNIYTATDFSGNAADSLVEGASTGTAASFKKSIAAQCAITLTVADGGSCVPSAGTGQVFVEYVVQN